MFNKPDSSENPFCCGVNNGSANKRLKRIAGLKPPMEYRPSFSKNLSSTIIQLNYTDIQNYLFQGHGKLAGRHDEYSSASVLKSNYQYVNNLI